MSDVRVGLVLGGGGVTGAAFHAGALTALHTDLGFDARDASVIVGTSTGSITGALLRAGVSAGDLAAAFVGAPIEFSHPLIAEWLRQPPVLPPFDFGRYLRLPRMPRPRLLVDIVNPFGVSRLRHLVMAMVADGEVELEAHLAPLDAVLPDWTEAALWICAATRAGQRAVFGVDATEPVLSRVVAASCAVPGYFEPVRIGHRRYVDGGVVSPTNADVLTAEHVDAAIVISPMSGVTSTGNTLMRAMRGYCSRVLRREIATLERRGIPTIVLAPGVDAQRYIAFDVMSDANCADIVRWSFLDSGDALREQAELAASIAPRGAYAVRAS